MTDQDLCYTLPHRSQLRIRYAPTDHVYRAELTLPNDEVLRHASGRNDAVRTLIHWAIKEDAKELPRAHERGRL